MRTVFCQKLKKEAPGLNKAPYPGPLGEKIYTSISQEAWSLWLKQQTLLINENRLNVLAPETRTFIEKEMHQFLFEDKEVKPAEFVPTDKKS